MYILYYDYMLIEIFKNLKSQHSRIFNFLKLKTIFLKLLHLYR